MALTPLQALNKVFDDQVADLRLTSARLLRNLAEKNRIRAKEDTQINWDVNTGGAQTAWEPVTANASENGVSNVVPTNLTIGQYRLKHQFPISKIAIKEASRRAPQELEDLFGSHVRDGLLHLLREMNRTLYLGDGSAAWGGFVGLDRVIDDSHNYAGVNVTSVPAWKALNMRGTFNAANSTYATRAISKDLFLDLEEQVLLKETAYDLIVTSPAVGKAYNKVFDQNTSPSALVTADDGRFKYVDLGHAGRYYNGVPIIEDPHCPAGIMYFLNSQDITVYTYSVAMTPQPDITNDSTVTNNTLGLIVNLSELPLSNPDMRTFDMRILPQMRVFNRKSVITIRDIA